MKIYYFASFDHFLTWVDWNLYANGHLLLIFIWSFILVRQLTGIRVKMWQALANTAAVVLVWLFVVYTAYGTGVG
ncbi:hypothetical protein F862_gp015 [Vibrio phage vB_VpaS_MAR10]|uniref:Uncharacterized protein n=1 Tax=Vibrio phage vB_VpaS_MAR10 TaxID=1229755 RepID=K7RFG3_9CAUD|nr:hypothetical protein F862_gp015 [Vibrio phage vB_VpaS_MAR10]AFV81247.1 hypothetical protein MAR10_015 [Vibrio phage vB_VpaS_MAR10]